MKNAKRCLAILLAVTLLCSNGVSQLGTIVSASELETTEEAQPKGRCSCRTGRRNEGRYWQSNCRRSNA